MALPILRGILPRRRYTRHEVSGLGPNLTPIQPLVFVNVSYPVRLRRRMPAWSLIFGTLSCWRCGGSGAVRWASSCLDLS